MSAQSLGSKLLKVLPGLQVLRTYDRQDFGHDALAGFAIVLVLIPSTLAYAQLAGTGPVGGIYSAIVGTLVYFLFASSRHMNVGPDGAVALLAGTVIFPLTEGDPEQGAIVGAWLALFTGVILIAAAILQLGTVASFLSAPVLVGYLNGAAFAIVVSQWGGLFGIDLVEDSFILRAIEWGQNVGKTHLPTLAVGTSVILLLVLFKRLTPKIPPLVPVFVAVLICGLLVDFQALGISTIGEIRHPAPQTVGLTFDLHDIATLAVGALGLSMLILPEGLLLAGAMAEKHRYKIMPDRELLALGASNIASGCFLGFTIGGSQTRTLLNSATGGRTQVANLVSAALLMAFLTLAAESIVRLPQVAIAGILVYTAFGLLEFKQIRHMFDVDRRSAWVAIATAFSVVFIGVLAGILLGTALSIAILLKQVARPEDALLGLRADSESLHDFGKDEGIRTIPGLVAYRFYGPLIFANVSFFIERLQGFIERHEGPVRMVLLDATAIPLVDFTAVEKLRPFMERLKQQNIDIAVSGARKPLRDSTLAFMLLELIPEENFFPRTSEALAVFRQRKSLES